MAEITITQALSTLKVLEKRLKAKLGVSDNGRRTLNANLKLVAVSRGSHLRDPYTSYKEEDFIATAKASMQSIEDLDERIITIKNAIAASNAVTMVKIAGKEMTVQEAIIRKQYSELRKQKIEAYKAELKRAREEFQEVVDENRSYAERLANGESSDSKKFKDAEEFVSNTYAASLIDPCDLQNKIERMEQDFEDFVANIDFVLSESNATTKIIIPD